MTCNDAAGWANGARIDAFILVNLRNIIVTPFSGRSLNATPYLPFNNAIRRLIFVQGSDGEVLLKVLDKIEALGPTKLTNEELNAMITRYPKMTEFDTAVKSVLLNRTIGTSNSIIRHSVSTGFDAWRKFFSLTAHAADR